MIIRKPYAFLIKNFRKIHIALLILGFYVFYKTVEVFGFVNEFMNLGVYDLYADPITKHITGLMQLSVLLMIIGSASFVLLLRHKKKPWKTYLVPFLVYLLLFFVLSMIKSFFRTYTDIVATTNIRLSRDLLMIFLIGQLPAMGIFIFRIFGVDIHKFNFNADLDNLDLDDKDREEIEIGLDIDIYTFIRLGRRFLRNLKYFYREHKLISCSAIFLVCAFFIYHSYIFLFVHNRTYKQGQVYNTNGYSITVLNSYYTDKDNTGNVISKDSNFVIVEFEVKNNHESRSLDTSNFHLKAGSRDYSTTETTYSKEFEDLGTSYSRVRQIKKDEAFRFIIIYKVKKSTFKSRYVLYYQEKYGIFKLRKIKLKLKDLRKMEKTVTLSSGDFMDISLSNMEDSIGFESYAIDTDVTYKVNKCTTLNCQIQTKEFHSSQGFKVLSVEFFSDYFEAKNMIDFLSKYGKIDYKDSKGQSRSIDITIAVDKKYFGKVVYIKIPDEVASSSDIAFHFVIRNKDIIYQLL